MQTNLRVREAEADPPASLSRKLVFRNRTTASRKLVGPVHKMQLGKMRKKRGMGGRGQNSGKIALRTLYGRPFAISTKLLFDLPFARLT